MNIKTMIICYAKEEDPDIVNSITGPIYYVPVENKTNHLIRISERVIILFFIKILAM